MHRGSRRGEPAWEAMKLIQLGLRDVGVGGGL